MPTLRALASTALRDRFVPAMRGRVLRALWLVSVLLLAVHPGRGAAAESQALVTVYAEDFSAGAAGWRTYPRDVENVSGSRMQWSPEGYVFSRSPWWPDLNHLDPGPGALHLLAVLWMKGKFNGMPYQSMDLRNARLSFRLRQPVPLRLHGARLVFWFQTLDAATGKFVNYALTGIDLAKGLDRDPSKWRDFELVLGTNAADWTCLSTREEKADVYGCAASVEAALADVNNDFGLILLPVDTERLPSGAIALDDVRLQLHLPR